MQVWKVYIYIELRGDKVVSDTIGRHVNGKWLNFPDPPKQDQVLRWFFELQQEFFTSQRGVYYTTHDQALAGSEAKRQLGLS